MTQNTEAAREARARRLARRQGLAIRKSRAHAWNCDNYLGYMIVDPFRNAIEAGQRYDLSIEEVEAYLADE